MQYLGQRLCLHQHPSAGIRGKFRSPGLAEPLPLIDQSIALKTPERGVAVRDFAFPVCILYCIVLLFLFIFFGGL